MLPKNTSSSWNKIAEQFSDLPHDKVVDWVCGYFPSWEYGFGLDIKKDNKSSLEHILDFGCGKGSPAEFLNRMFKIKVTGIDPNKNMVKEAIKKSKNGLSFMLYDGETIPFKEDHFSAAMSNYVFLINEMSDTQKQINAAKEIYRVLSPGAPFILLVGNPDATGVRFSCIQSGHPGKIYRPGEPIDLFMFSPGQIPNDQDKLTQDIWWPEDHYLSVMQKAGFTDIKTYKPVLKDKYHPFIRKLGIEPATLKKEREIAPAMFLVGYKAG